MKDLRGKGAAVTGAGAGIGRALAVRLAAEGCRVAIADIDDKRLLETERLLAAEGASVDRARVDVTDRREVQAWADRVVEALGPVHLVINNAGVALSASVEAMSHDDLEWVMAVNFWGVVHGTMAFLPHLKKTGDGCIVNVSSVLGLVGLPLQSAYAASKFAERGFTEVLSQELEIERSGVRAVCVHPGGVRTDLVRSGRIGGTGALGPSAEEIVSRFDRLARLSAEDAARAIVSGVKRNRRRILVGADAFLLDRAERLSHGALQSLIVRRSRRRRSAR